MVVFPLPVRPKMPSVLPGSREKETFLMTGSPGLYANVTSSKVTESGCCVDRSSWPSRMLVSIRCSSSILCKPAVAL